MTDADKSHIGDKSDNKCKTEADVEKYNCAQRAHQNTVESISTVQLLGALNGLLYPKFSACCLVRFSCYVVQVSVLLGVSVVFTLIHTLNDRANRDCTQLDASSTATATHPEVRLVARLAPFCRI